ncbi:hypothetical protein MNBD_DELTA01-195 [hydrothermal vent metagenome]|uniref:Uncharacterized protein n=1 Tax=hydrothermal vent metagenome TaxID=652676 RepID=A0A3B0QU03_9ZZZZ
MKKKDFTKRWLSDLENDLKIPRGFFNSLVDEKYDWSFVVKLHALMETALAFLLAKKLNTKLSSKDSIEITKFLKMDMSLKRNLLKDLNLLQNHKQLLQFLSELRSEPPPTGVGGI